MKGFKKMGLMFLALVIALAGIGGAYAAWTDTLTISGTVNTGTVDIDLVKVSGTWVFKVVDNPDYPDEVAVIHHDTNVPFPQPLNGDGTLSELIAYANPTIDGGRNVEGDHLSETANVVTVTWDHLFPSVWFMVDILWHYDGSVPAKVNTITWDHGADTWLDDLEASNDAIAFQVLADESGQPIDEYGDPIAGEVNRAYIDTNWGSLVFVDLGYQLHHCDYVLILLFLHIPQLDIYEGLSGSSTGEIEVIQWNEYLSAD